MFGTNGHDHGQKWREHILMSSNSAQVSLSFPVVFRNQPLGNPPAAGFAAQEETDEHFWVKSSQ